MKRDDLNNLCFSLLFFVVVGAVGFGWMYILLELLTSLTPAIQLIVSLITGPILAIGWIFLINSRGNTTLIEMTINGSLPIGPIAVLASLRYWTSLSLAWSIPAALILGLPVGLLIGLCSVLIFGGLGYCLWQVACLCRPALKREALSPTPEEVFDPDDISWILRRADDPQWECHVEGCHKPVVKHTRLCREHLVERALDEQTGTN